MDQERLVRKYRSRGILLDTGVLLLWLVGGYDKSLVGKRKRIMEFAPEDVDTLSQLLALFRNRITTPTVLAEVSNLARQTIPPPHPLRYCQRFAEEVETLKESWVRSSLLARSSSFARFGLTDAALVRGARKFLVLTTDSRLAAYLGKSGLDCLNFNHIRPLGWVV